LSTSIFTEASSSSIVFSYESFVICGIAGVLTEPFFFSGGGADPLFVGRSSSFPVGRPVPMRRPVSALEAAVAALEPIVEET
jgi:hypothetical protein